MFLLQLEIVVSKGKINEYEFLLVDNINKTNV